MDVRAQEVRRRGLEALTRYCGPIIDEALADPKVTEIMLNPDGRLWIEYVGERSTVQAGDLDIAQAMGIITTVAGMRETVVTADNPILECELPSNGSRFEALIPPIVARPAFTIRKSALLLYTLADYIQQGIMAQAQGNAIENAVAARQNILICGGTTTGKTTLASAILEAVARIDPKHRIVIIEDTHELQSKADNVAFLRTSDSVNMTMLLRATMRLRPDRIVVGEVRDASALALLKAWNTGHPGGVGTVHANNSAAALVRIGQLIQEAGVPPAPELIAEAVNVVVSIVRTATGRRVQEVLRVRGYSPQSGFETEPIA
ncbi:MAG: P-type conjugative transfer ATPase TrbB [Burkholderiaceae bacterium]|jgi:type IV secretion system protein VirB11|nr:P-type conjugative transfer ATPase TrbB [Burkholderiaceae bacterium]